MTAFFVMLLGLPILATVLPGIPGLRVFAGFYQAGSLVFGGGHVVLPLLQAQTVEKGLITNGRLLAGYGAVQAVPGLLFTFAGYLGAVLRAPEPHGWAGGLLCLAAQSPFASIAVSLRQVLESVPVASEVLNLPTVLRRGNSLPRLTQ